MSPFPIAMKALLCAASRHIRPLSCALVLSAGDVPGAELILARVQFAMLELGTISKITPNSNIANWTLANINSAPGTSPALNTNAQDKGLMCLDAAHSNAFIAIGNGDIWLYVP